MANYRLHQWFTTREPLSHIGEVISTTSYLIQEPILQPDGTIEEVFVYNGNAWRGQLRDLMATYMLEQLGQPQISLDAFHLLYAGGGIGGKQTTNVAQVRQIRRTIPLIAILGGGVGNQVLPGKIRVSNIYPVCREAPPSMVPVDGDLKRSISYRGLTFEKEFSRMDDAKNPDLNGALEASHDPPALAQAGMFAEEPPKAKRDNKPPEQMRIRAELLASGVQLVGHIELLDVSDVELGCLVSGLHAFSRSPKIGGKVASGHGRVELKTELLDLDSGEIHAFAEIRDRCLLAPVAEGAKTAYDDHLRDLYEAMLAESDAEIKQLIGAVA